MLLDDNANVKTRRQKNLKIWEGYKEPPQKPVAIEPSKKVEAKISKSVSLDVK